MDSRPVRVGGRNVMLLVAVAMAVGTPAVKAQADADKPAPLRYLRPAGGQFVLESEVSGTKADDKWIYSSRTVRGPEKMTLTLTYEKGSTLTRAEATLDTGTSKQTAQVVFDKNGAQLKRPGGVTDFIKVNTAAP